MKSEKKPHAHRLPDTCTCDPLGLEPDEECPRHGAGPWPPRCADCGQFLPYSALVRMWTEVDDATT